MIYLEDIRQLRSWNVELKQTIEQVKKANLQFVHTGNFSAYFKESVEQWLEDQTSGDPVKLLNYFRYCLRKQVLEVY